MPADRMTGPRVGIIGAGPGGLALGIFLRKAGFRDFTIFDREDGVGGTWRINTYPGLACDVKSHLYSYSFDLNPNWSRLWSGQPEILEYFEQCAQRYKLTPNLRLGTEIRSAQWDSETGTWCLTALGDLDPAETRPRLHAQGALGFRTCSVGQKALSHAVVVAQRSEHLGDRTRQRQNPRVQGARSQDARIRGQ